MNKTEPDQKAALSQVEYLDKKLQEIEQQISQLENEQTSRSNALHELYFQKGKLFADLELMKRVPSYD